MKNEKPIDVFFQSVLVTLGAGKIFFRLCLITLLCEGVFVDIASSVWISDSTFIGNHANGAVAGGGGIAMASTSTAVVTNTIFRENAAIGSGQCFYSDKLLQCPSSIGGAIFVQGNLTLARSFLSNNSAACDSLFPCAARGAALGATSSQSYLTVVDSVISENVLNCDRSASCVVGLGGGLYSDGGRVRSENSSIVRNLVTGVCTQNSI